MKKRRFFNLFLGWTKRFFSWMRQMAIDRIKNVVFFIILWVFLAMANTVYCIIVGDKVKMISPIELAPILISKLIE